MIIDGTVIQGHGIASGKAKDSPYPEGSLTMQAPFFKSLGLDLSPYFLGTLNVDISPQQWKPVKPDHTFKNVNWTPSIPAEHFSFFKCSIIYDHKKYEAFIYYPHPETKVTHFQNPSIVEIISEKITDLTYGKNVQLVIEDHKIAVG